ncbi:MAG: choloylglycine hydrolase family protein [Roseobacter sp.]
MSAIKINVVLQRAKSLFAAASIVVLGSQSALACTGIVLRAQDGTVVPARTMEFGFDVKSNILAVPAGTRIETLVLDSDQTGFTFEAKYGFLGANGLGKPIIADGINTEGLYFGAFYFKGDAVFGTADDTNRDHAVSSEELGNWVLGQFATVDEVKAALPTIEVVGTFIDAIAGVAPFHFAVTDVSGASVIIEYTADGLAIHDNTVNVVTNNPPYDWHITNLRNYIGLQAENFSEITVGSQTLEPFGQGTGLAGIPGDFTSPSRFVRATAFVNSALPSRDADEAIFNAFHILNAFDIPKGAIRESVGDEVHTDYTVWTSAADTKNVQYYYKTYLTQAVEVVDVRAVLSKLTEPKTLVMESGFSIGDRTGDF